MLPELDSQPEEEVAARPEPEREVEPGRSACRVSPPPLVDPPLAPLAIRVVSSPPASGVEQCGHTSTSASTAAPHEGQDTTMDTRGF